MDTEEFLLVRDLVHHESLVEVGLGELRRSTPPAASVQECALLAEEHGRLPTTTSFVGPLLLAPEMLRLLGSEGEPGEPGTATIALARDLRLPSSKNTGSKKTTGLVAWDCDGADTALSLAHDGTVTAFDLSPRTPRTPRTQSPATVDLRLSTRRIPPDAPAKIRGRLNSSQHTQWQAFALVMVGSELLGAARSLLQQSVEYARDRRQYGHAIGSFQAVQHLLADATVLVEACTSATRYAAWSLDHQQPDQALKAARVAKAEANTSLPEAVRIAMQVFGGIAQTWEHPAHLYLRKILVGSITLATTADLLAALAEPEPEA